MPPHTAPSTASTPVNSGKPLGELEILPPELRIIVYDFVFEDLSPSDFTAPLLQTNSFIYIEAVSIYFAHLTQLARDVLIFALSKHHEHEHEQFRCADEARYESARLAQGRACSVLMARVELLAKLRWAGFVELKGEVGFEDERDMMVDVCITIEAPWNALS